MLLSNRSEIRCLGASENCGVGEGMKRCPNGAAVAVDTTCVNLRLDEVKQVEQVEHVSTSQDL